MPQASIANRSRYGVALITPDQLRSHGTILNVLKQIAASIDGSIASGRVARFEHVYDIDHVLRFAEFADLVEHDPELTNLKKQIQTMMSDINLMNLTYMLIKAKAVQQHVELLQ